MNFIFSRSMAMFWLFLFMEVFAPLCLAAPQLKIDPPAKKISTDQRAILIVQLQWPQAEGPYEINSLEPKLENLTLEAQNQSQSISSRRLQGGMGQSQETGTTVLYTITYEFRPFKKGTGVIYPFEVTYRRSENEPWIPILIPEQQIKIVSSFPLRSLLIGLSVLILFFVSFKVWRTARIQKAAKDLPLPDPKQRLYAKAEESIATYVSPDPKEKLTQWFEQFRNVVAAHYDIPSAAATNTEILSFLRSKELPVGEWKEISRLFEQMSEMQFSRQDIPSYDLERMQKTLLQYVKGKIIIGNSAHERVQ